MIFSDFLSLIPESIVGIAVLIAIMMFLRHQAGQDVRLNKISERCHNTQIEIQKGYIDLSSDQNRVFQDSMKLITQAHLSSSTAVRERLSSIEHNLSDLVASINQMVGKMK